MRNYKKIGMPGVKVPNRLYVSKLNGPNMHRTVRDKLDRFEFDSPWDHFKEQVYLLSRFGISRITKKKHQDWFDENDTYTNQSLSEKRCLYSTLLNQGHQNKTTVKTYKEIKGTFQKERELRCMKNEWSASISKEVQKPSDLKDAKTLYSDSCDSCKVKR